MTVAEERYEKAWNSFLIYLNHHPKAQLKRKRLRIYTL